MARALLFAALLLAAGGLLPAAADAQGYTCTSTTSFGTTSVSCTDPCLSCGLPGSTRDRAPSLQFDLPAPRPSWDSGITPRVPSAPSFPALDPPGGRGPCVLC